MSEITVSVAMITYNHEQFIAQAIDSVLAQQTPFPVEIVIGDDCSTDGTRAIIETYRHKYGNRIRTIYPKSNVGMLNNLAAVLTACGGKYIALLEGDDYWVSSSKLQKQVSFLDQNFEYSSCAHNALKIDQETDASVGKYCPPSHPEVLTLEDLLKWDSVPTCSVMFRNGLFKQLPDWFFRLSMGDWSLLVLCARHGKMHFDPDSMACYRLHSGGVWSKISRARQLKGLIEARWEFHGEFQGAFSKLTREMVSENYFELANLEAGSGNQSSARSAMLRCLFFIRIRSLIRRTEVQKAAIRILFPSGYNLLKRALFSSNSSALS